MVRESSRLKIAIHSLQFIRRFRFPNFGCGRTNARGGTKGAVVIFVKGPLPLSLDPNDSPVPFMLVDVGGDGIETKPITSLDGRSRRRRRLCFVIYPRGWSGNEGSGLGCVNRRGRFAHTRCRTLQKERSGGQKPARSAGRALLRSHAATKAVHTCS